MPIIPTTKPLREAVARFDAETRDSTATAEGIALVAARVKALHDADLLGLTRVEVGVILAGLNALIDEEAQRLQAYKAEVHNEVAALMVTTGGETC